MNMNFNQLVERVLAESKALALPPRVEKIVPNIIDWIKSLCVDSLLQRNQICIDIDKVVQDQSRFPDIEPDELEEFEYDLINATTDYPHMGTLKTWHLEDDPEDDNQNIQDDIRVSLYTLHSHKGGDATTQFNSINIYLPFGKSTNKSLYSYHDTAWLYHMLRHELMHLYDPTLLRSNRMYVDTNKTQRQKKKYEDYVQKQQSAQQDFQNRDYQQYHTRPGYRSGKIPIEFYPNLRTILDEHSISQLQSFLRKPDFNPLAYKYSKFVEHVFADSYLKRKFLEKIAQHVDFHTQREIITVKKAIQEAQPGDVFAWYNESSLGCVHRLIDTPNELKLWRDMLDDDDNVYKIEATNFEDFKRKGQDYVEDYSINPINFDLLKPLQKFKGKYIIMHDNDNGAIMFGKELW